MDDDTLIAADIAYARAHQQEISDACARMIASQYHNGGTSTGLQFASAGAISNPSDVWSDLFYTPGDESAYENMGQAGKDKADMLGTYLQSKGTRGPVEGWAGLWLRLASGY